MDQAALDEIADQAYAEGRVDALSELVEEQKAIINEHRRLREILEVEGDQSLADAAEHMAEECRAHREATRAAAVIIEQRRHEVVDLRMQLQQMEQKLTEMRLWADKQHAADQAHIRELQEAIEPKQQKIYELQRALLQYIKETA